MSEKSVGTIIDAALKIVDVEHKKLSAQEAKLRADIDKLKEDMKAKERELSTVEVSILQIERSKAKAVKDALKEAGIKLEPTLAKAAAGTAGGGATGDGSLRNGAPKEVLAYIVKQGKATTSEIAEHFQSAEFAKRLPVILSQALKKKGYVTAEKTSEGRGSVFTPTAAGAAAVV